MEELKGEAAIKLMPVGTVAAVWAQVASVGGSKDRRAVGGVKGLRIASGNRQTACRKWRDLIEPGRRPGGPHVGAFYNAAKCSCCV